MGAVKGKYANHSEHRKWIWFEFDREFKGYSEDLELERVAQKAIKDAEAKALLDASIADGTYGVNSKDAGGVYLISCGDFYKIGYSKNVKSRLSSIKTSSPYEVSLITKYTPYGKSLQMLESHLHEKYKDSRHNLEWFRKDFTPEDFIQSCIDYCKLTGKTKPSI